jgi:hypothetical protein
MNMSETKRRTVSIKAMVETVNARNRLSTCSAEVREGWNSLLEDVLHAGNVYAGFGYLTHDEVPAGHPAGIVHLSDDSIVFPDETRRYYYISRALTGEKLRRVSKHVYVSEGPRLPRDPMGAHGTLPSGDVL